MKITHEHTLHAFINALGLIFFTKDTKETEYSMNKRHMFPQVRLEFESISQKLQKILNKFTDQGVKYGHPQ